MVSKWFLNATCSYSYVLVLKAFCVPLRQRIYFKIQMLRVNDTNVGLHKIAKILHDIFINFIIVHAM